MIKNHERNKRNTFWKKQIDLMQEYRTSIISQAVTGKIDVRKWQPKARKYQTEELPVAIAAEN